MERVLLEENHVQKRQLLEMEGRHQSPKAPEILCVSPPAFLSYFVFIQISRAYKCELIVRSRAVDPRRTERMMEYEKVVQEYLQDLKCSLIRLYPHEWKKKFQFGVDEVIQKYLLDAMHLQKIPCQSEGKKELQRIGLHAIRRLVAGAFQEGELAWQPDCATACAKIDGALIWNGRGYVIKNPLAISSFQPPVQSSSNTFSPTLWLVIR